MLEKLGERDADVVRVLNKNQGIMKDKYGGVEYTFHPGAHEFVPREAAEHFFAYGLPEKEKVQKMRRMGLATHKDGWRIFNNFIVKECDGADRVSQSDSSAAA